MANPTEKTESTAQLLQRLKAVTKGNQDTSKPNPAMLAEKPSRPTDKNSTFDMPFMKDSQIEKSKNKWTGIVYTDKDILSEAQEIKNFFKKEF